MTKSFGDPYASITPSVHWSQRWELNPHTPGYEPSTLPLGDAAMFGIRGGN
jgi:hypothetical protein